MTYTKESIYKYSGQYDKIVIVTFKWNSDSFKKFGEYIIGKFYYTPKERDIVQKLLENEVASNTHGYVKFKPSEAPKLSEENVIELDKKGLLTSDIIEILQFSHIEENKFSKTEKRALPKPMVIKSSFTNEDEEDLMIYLNNQRLKSGYKLIPDEINKHNAIIFRKYEPQIRKSDNLYYFIDSTTHEIKPELKYYYLQSKYYHDELSEVELEEFKSLINQKAQEKVGILGNELKKSTEHWDEIGINYKKGVSILVHLITNFEAHRITNVKFPIWWDLEKFLHIYMRHVDETQIGERFEIKTVFQYKLNDIKDLIKIVLDKTEKEIDEHFEKNPNKDFFRIGERSVYYNGDFYSFHIEKSGRLMTFHKI
jgi:hypothetical protein